MIFALTGYQNQYRARGVFSTRAEAKEYLYAIMTPEEIKYLTIKIVNLKELYGLQKKGIKVLC